MAKPPMPMKIGTHMTRNTVHEPCSLTRNLRMFSFTRMFFLADYGSLRIVTLALRSPDVNTPKTNMLASAIGVVICTVSWPFLSVATTLYALFWYRSWAFA